MNRIELFSNWVETRIESLGIKASVEKNQKVDGLEIQSVGFELYGSQYAGIVYLLLISETLCEIIFGACQVFCVQVVSSNG